MMSSGLVLRFLREEAGQDFVEYTLLLASIALAGAAIFIAMNPVMSGLWNIANTRLNNASN